MAEEEQTEAPAEEAQASASSDPIEEGISSGISGAIKNISGMFFDFVTSFKGLLILALGIGGFMLWNKSNEDEGTEVASNTPAAGQSSQLPQPSQLAQVSNIDPAKLKDAQPRTPIGGAANASMTQVSSAGVPNHTQPSAAVGVNPGS